MSVPLIHQRGQTYGARLFAPAPIGADTIAGSRPARFARAGLPKGGIVATGTDRIVPERVARLAFTDAKPHTEAPHRQRLRGARIDRLSAGACAS
jgi:hypothetical protein